MTADEILPDEAPIKRYTYRKLFSCIGLEHFRVQWLEEVDDVGFDKDDAEQTIKIDGGHVYVLPCGLAAQSRRTDKGQVWAAFETKVRAEQREHIARFAAFARGHWTLDCPVDPGVYPVVAKSVAISSELPWSMLTEWQTRKLQRVEGVVRDVTEHTPLQWSVADVDMRRITKREPASRSLWRGYWWSEPLPMMVAPVK